MNDRKNYILFCVHFVLAFFTVLQVKQGLAHARQALPHGYIPRPFSLTGRCVWIGIAFES